MSGETKLTVIGNLTADPELRYTQGGLAVVNFTIASTPRTFDQPSNTMKDGEPLFMRASAWRDFAEHIAHSLKKGMRVVAAGQLRQRQYETQQGEKRSSWELEVEAIGADLRWATAEITRATSGAPAVRPADEPWATSGPSDDVWNTPGNYNDETPF